MLIRRVKFNISDFMFVKLNIEKTKWKVLMKKYLHVNDY